MTKNILNVLFFTLFSMGSFAQIKPRLFEFGPKAGVQITGIQHFDTTTIDKKVSLLYQGGIFTRFNVAKFSLQPEFIYQVKGATFKTPQAKYQYKYFSTPILLGFTPIKGIYFETGPEFSWAINKGYKKEGLTVYGPDKAKDYGWVVGTRINMLDMFSLASLNIRYTHGLTNVSTSKQGLTPLDLRNRTVQISFSYTFSEYYIWKKKYGVKKRK
jgi:Outer membrane protein beta-barrel domain